MGVFYQEEPPNPSKRCKLLASALKDAFSNCHSSGVRRSSPSPEEENPATDFNDEQEVVVSAIRSRALEAKLRRKASLTTGSFYWFSPTELSEVFVTTPKAVKQTQNNNGGCSDGEREEFLTAGSCLSCCSSAQSSWDEFFSVKTNFPRSMSLSGLDFPDFRRRLIIQELCHCEGWPFGLCRKALLLPPLPKSPSESWTWRKGNRMVKLP
ncbi:uncharacterized protein LOC131151791 [Malania oleifera]|uniref:uncharacterized protein LOC131151791 n=1 Tax=Malania oleifera TaxID=397392 RepID=UPI0025ADDFA4|nr:uncharacterized protein LOC131151791 [Malania oleifera]